MQEAFAVTSGFSQLVVFVLSAYSGRSYLWLILGVMEGGFPFPFHTITRYHVALLFSVSAFLHQFFSLSEFSLCMLMGANSITLLHKKSPWAPFLE